MKQIYVLYACDEWKRNNHLVCATLSENKLKKIIISEIEKRNMEYNSGDCDDFENTKKQIKEFKADWKTLNRDSINNRINYGWYDYIYDGEVY